MSETFKGWGLASQNRVTMNQEYKLCSIFKDVFMGFAFQHWLIIISIFPKRNTGGTFISSLHVLPETPLGSQLLWPLSWELPTSFVSRTHLDLSLWCPADSSLYKLPVITKQIQSSRQMLIKGYIKKSKTLQMDQQHISPHFCNHSCKCKMIRWCFIYTTLKITS